MVEYYDRAVVLFRELGDLTNLALSLTGRGHAACSTYPLLTLVRSAVPIHPRRDLEEAARLSREIGSPASEAWVLWSMGLLCMVQGQYGQALEAALNSLEIATQIGHRESLVTSQCVLGILFTELLAPEQARPHLEGALVLSKELHNRAMIHWATGASAASHCQLGVLPQAQSCLDTVLSSETPMDTMYVRYCWARRAELALAQDDPALTLEITDRLIASAPGMSPSRVITFLWKLKGEALAATGHTGQAEALLQSAIENAQATREHFLLWRLHASLGHVHGRMGEATEAEAHFATARQLVDELADTIRVQALRDSFLRGAHRLLRSCL
jgi:tetratricopeptide (TPR) repeat protein